MSKLTMIFFGSLIVGMGSLFASRVCAEINSFGIYSYICVPDFVPFTPRCACETTGVVYVFSRVLLILCMCANPKIVNLIIQSITVFVIRLHAVWRVRYNSVHPYRLLLSVSSLSGRVPRSTKRFCAWIVACKPFMLIEFLIPFVRNFCYLILRQLNKFHVISKQNGLRFVGSVRNKSQSYFNTNCLLNPSNLYYTTRSP